MAVTMVTMGVMIMMIVIVVMAAVMVMLSVMGHQAVILGDWAARASALRATALKALDQS